MEVEIGRVEALFRYPVKSMRGEALAATELGFHGVAGDRRLALRRVQERGAFPWLSASRVPELVLYAPQGGDDGGPPAAIRTPGGRDLPPFGEELAEEIGRRHGAPVEMMQMKHGVFDDASVSVITSDTVGELGRLSATPPDVRRFRPNVLLRSARGVPFEEDGWLGGLLVFGDGDDAPAVAVTMLDVRCAMVNIGPDDGRLSPAVMKAVVQANGNNAGVYGTVTRAGRLAVGQRVLLRR